MSEIIHNVNDRRRGFIGSWLAEPLEFAKLTDQDVGRNVIYRDFGRASVGVMTSFRDGVVFARYSQGDASSCAEASDLMFGIRPLDTPAEIEAALQEIQRQPIETPNPARAVKIAQAIFAYLTDDKAGPLTYSVDVDRMLIGVDDEISCRELAAAIDKALGETT